MQLATAAEEFTNLFQYRYKFSRVRIGNCRHGPEPILPKYTPSMVSATCSTTAFATQTYAVRLLINGIFASESNSDLAPAMSRSEK